VTFAANSTTAQTVTVAITDDNIVEATESFLASLALDATTPLTGYSTTLSDTGTGTITDNDTATFTINDVTVNEAAGTLTFTVSLSTPIDTVAKVNVSYGGGTAAGGGTDYDSASDPVTFAANSTTAQTVTVAITDDNIVEATESFLASLALDATTPLTGYSTTLSDTGTGTITDNDTATFTITMSRSTRLPEPSPSRSHCRPPSIRWRSQRQLWRRYGRRRRNRLRLRVRPGDLCGQLHDGADRNGGDHR
jgi:hypothetical protein